LEPLENFIAQFSGKIISVAAHDLHTGKEIFINADVVMHPASTMKIPVMLEVYRQVEAGLLSLDDRLEIHNAFTSIADASAFSLDAADDSELSFYRRIGETESIRELVRLMIVRSSNLASNILMDKVTTARVDAIVKEHGIPDMHIIRGLEDKKALQLGMNNAASARSSAQMLKLIAEGVVVSQQACNEMIQILLEQEFNESIPALLPAEVKVAHKTGWSDDFFHDIGIVFPPQRKPYILALFTHGFPVDAEAHACMAEVSRIIYDTLQK
jgi:beta-lactamase class A